jgi:hypothetical protein
LSDKAKYAAALTHVAKAARSHFDVSVFHAAIDKLFETPSGKN